MKKIISTIFLLVTLTVGVYAQSPIKFGVDAGMNLSTSSMDPGSGDKSMKVGFQLGFVAEYELPSNFFLQSGLSFTTKGFKYDLFVADDSDYGYGYGNGYGYGYGYGSGYGNDYGYSSIARVKSTWNQMYLQLPVYVGYKLEIAQNTKLVFNFGPYFAYGVGGKIKAKSRGEKDSEDLFGDELLKRFDFGLGAGAGIEFGSYFAGLKYELGLTDISRGYNECKNRNASFSVGYRF